MPSNVSDAPLREERIGGALLLTIDRPEAGNSLDEPTILALQGRIGVAGTDLSLRCIILAGSGRFFCAGGDLKAYRALATPPDLERVFGAARTLLDAIEACPLPVIAAVDGFALGGGAELALACDVRVAGEGARIGFPQLRLGIITGWDGMERLVRLIGRGTAMRLLLSGERLTAEAAWEAGLVEIVATDARAAALEMAASLESAAPLAIRGCKAAMRALDSPPSEARRVAAETFSRLWFTDDHREAERAFAEKRTPVFHGQ